MIEKISKSGMLSMSCDSDHILHRIGSDDYSPIRRIVVKNSDEDKWEEVAVSDIPPYTRQEYIDKTISLIREKYTDSDEFALQRKMLNTMMPQTLSEDEVVNDSEKVIAEYTEYNQYVESCKAKAKEILSQPRVEEIINIGENGQGKRRNISKPSKTRG